MVNTQSEEYLASNFETKIRSRKNQEKYRGEYISELFIRYMQNATSRVNDIIEKEYKNISPKGIVKKLDKNFKNQYGIKSYSISYENYRDVLMNIGKIGDEYNTEDGQIRWLQDNNYDIHLGSFYSILPQEIKEKMTEWNKMGLPLKITIELREKLEKIGENYNTEDGQIRWLQDNIYDINLGHFYGILPQEVKEKMTKWNKMGLPLKITINIREKLKKIEEAYNTEDGEIRWLQYNNFEINLGHFYSILPQEVKEKMTEWSNMNLPLNIAIEVREKLKKIGEDYNTEDGQIRWLQDNNYEINLGHFYSILPQEIKKKMTEWNVMNLPLKLSIKVRKKLKEIGEDYNTEDGQIRWLQDNKYEINLGNFYSILPQEIKEKMTEWNKMRLPLKITIEVREKLKEIGDEYNTEDGQIRWLQDNNYDIHLGSFYSILPKKVKNKMTEWNSMNLPLKIAIEVREKLKEIGENYNTEDGQIRWLQDNNYEINLGHFYSILPQEIKKKMTEWNKMGLPLKIAIEVGEKLKEIEEDYNTEDGQIRWLQDNNYEINLGNFYSILPQEVKKKMTKWKFLHLTFIEAKNKYKL